MQPPFLSRLYCCVLVAVVLLFSLQCYGADEWKHNNNKRPHNPKPVETFYVDSKKSSNFSDIQSAIDSVPANNKNWICIRISAGTYREKVKIPYDKPRIILKGVGKRKTIVIWGDHNSLAQSPTFMSLADNIVVKSMSFVNSYNIEGSNRPRMPAVAALVSGDKSAFYKVGFKSLQDTLWDDQGRHYYHRCTIQGAIDFIFGSGQSIYEGCAIQVLGQHMEAGLRGYITAQGRTSPKDGNGFVFKHCNVFGTGAAYLGRAWRDYSRVLFYKSNLSSIIQPEGWDAWNSAGHEENLSFGEYGNYGPGSDTSKRVKWAKELSIKSVIQMTSMTYIDLEGWLHNQPL